MGAGRSKVIKGSSKEDQHGQCGCLFFSAFFPELLTVVNDGLKGESHVLQPQRDSIRTKDPVFWEPKTNGVGSVGQVGILDFKDWRSGAQSQLWGLDKNQTWQSKWQLGGHHEDHYINALAWDIKSFIYNHVLQQSGLIEGVGNGALTLVMNKWVMMDSFVEEPWSMEQSVTRFSRQPLLRGAVRLLKKVNFSLQSFSFGATVAYIIAKKKVAWSQEIKIQWSGPKKENVTTNYKPLVVGCDQPLVTIVNHDQPSNPIILKH